MEKESREWTVRVTREEIVEYRIKAKNGTDAVALALGHAVQGHTTEKWAEVAGFTGNWHTNWQMTGLEEIRKD